MIWLDLLQYLGTGLGVIAMAVISFLPRYIITGLTVSFISCIVLGSWGVLAGNEGIAISQYIYVIFNAVGIYNWSRLNKQPSQENLT